jgi:hypothetical protein
MIERIFFALFSLGFLVTSTTGLYQAAKWYRQETVSVEVRNSRLAIDSQRGSALLPTLHVELTAQADGAPTNWRRIELRQDEVGLGFGLLTRFAPGSTVLLRRTRGDASEIFLTAADAREPLEFAIAMGGLAFFCGSLLLVLRVLGWRPMPPRSAGPRAGSGPWLLFFSVGMLAITIGLGAGAFRSWQANFWQIVIAKRVEVPSASLPVSQLVISERAKQRFAETPVAWNEFDLAGKSYRMPVAACFAEPCVLLVNPYDPEDWTAPLAGDTEAWTPTWIGLLFGGLFTGAGWLTRRTGL